MTLFGENTGTLYLVPGINLPDSLVGSAEEIVKTFSDKGFRLEIVKKKAEFTFTNKELEPWYMELRAA